MAKQQTEEQALLETLNKAEHYLESNRKPLIYGFLGIAAVIAIFVYLKVDLLPSREKKAQEDIRMAQFYFDRDSFSMALNGDKKTKGFLKIADGGFEYSFTKAKNLSNFYAGICYLQTGKFDKAIDYLERFSSGETIIQAQAYNALGDAYAEKKNMDKALSNYKKAAAETSNRVLAPLYNLKAGMACEYLKDKEAALKYYQEVKTNYPNSEEGRDIEKYILRVGGEF